MQGRRPYSGQVVEPEGCLLARPNGPARALAAPRTPARALAISTSSPLPDSSACCWAAALCSEEPRLADSDRPEPPASRAAALLRWPAEGIALKREEENLDHRLRVGRR